MTHEQIVADVGLHVMTLSNQGRSGCRRQADVDAGAKPRTSGSDDAELREARRRIELLEQENEVLRRAAATLPGEPSGGSARGSTRP